jgi:pimeloyl-ACP methyl ester carboxylesterase
MRSLGDGCFSRRPTRKTTFRSCVSFHRASPLGQPHCNPLKDPRRLRFLVLYEPVLFSVLVADDPNGPATREILAVRDDTVRAVTLGDLEGAAERFVDYWLGAGSFAGMPEPRRSALANSMRKVRAEWHAAFHEPTLLTAFSAVDVPTLFLTGSESPASSRHVAGLLCKVLPQVTVMELEGLGHMGPVTHPERVNEVIEGFLREVP